MVSAYLFMLLTCLPLIASLAAAAASLRVPGADSDDETKTPSASPHHGRSRPPSLIADSSSESDEGDARGEVRQEWIFCCPELYCCNP